MWAFHSYLLYTLCLCPLKAVWVLCLCRFVGLLLLFFYPSTVIFFLYISTPRRPLPWQTTARAAKIMSRETNLFCRCAMSLHSDRVKTCSSSLNQMKWLIETDRGVKCWSFQGPRSLGSVEPSGSRDSTPGNMPRWNKPIFGPVSTSHLAVFQLKKSALQTMLLACDGSEILLPGLDHNSVYSVPSVVQSSGLFVISLWRPAIQSCTR